ncbi:NADPH-dependent FMN reductase [Streptomyces sp. NPDC021224]|uniref:NADPH-dependent FMN reductase n=1 Tax=unclassified Streptomyces TaxID=2593676 RepID=UPI0037AC8502
MTLTLGYLVGSLSRHSVNRRVARALTRLAPPEVTMNEIPIAGLPLYNQDDDAAFPEAALALKKAVETADGVIVVSPEHNRGVPGVLKNAVDYASRPWGDNSWTGKPVALVGAALGSAGTAVAQAQLRAVLGYCGTVVLGAPETCLRWTPDLIAADGSTSPETEEVLRAFLTATVAHVARHTPRISRR